MAQQQKEAPKPEVFHSADLKQQPRGIYRVVQVDGVGAVREFKFVKLGRDRWFFLTADGEAMEYSNNEMRGLYRCFQLSQKL